jgi:hypothetical protein
MTGPNWPRSPHTAVLIGDGFWSSVITVRRDARETLDPVGRDQQDLGSGCAALGRRSPFVGIITTVPAPTHNPHGFPPVMDRSASILIGLLRVSVRSQSGHALLRGRTPVLA